MTLEHMTLEELLEMLKSGRVCNINSYYMGMFIRYLEELKVTRKALELMAEGLATNMHCDRHPDCYIKEDEEDCLLIKECHSSKWLFDYYLEKARDEK